MSTPEAPACVVFDQALVGNLHNPAECELFADHIVSVIETSGGESLLGAEAIVAICELHKTVPAAALRALYKAPTKLEKALRRLMKIQNEELAAQAKKAAPAGEEPGANPLLTRYLEALANRPDAPVVVVGGEPAAMAAAALFPDHICLPLLDSNCNGMMPDLSALAGRIVVLWPSNDEQCLKYADAIHGKLIGSGTNARRIVKEATVIDLDVVADFVAGGLSKGWDLACAPATWTTATIDSIIAQNATPLPGGFSKRRDGIYWSCGDNQVKICGPIRIVAKTRNASNEDWGLLLRWRDPEGHLHQIAVSIEHIAGGGEELRKILSRCGLMVDVGRDERVAFNRFLNESSPGCFARCVSQPGWHNDLYILCDRYGTAISKGVEQVVPQGALFSEPNTVLGTLDEWKSGIGAICVGNSRLIFCVSTAFAAPLLRLVGAEGGGFHLRAGSSCGKSRCLMIAASVFGSNPGSWRTTDNGLEGLCAASNDSLLCLDELGQLKSEVVADAAYLIANGKSRRRMKSNTEMREVRKWRLLALSTGEISPASHASAGGKNLTAGADLRIVDVPVDAGVGFGVFENVYGASGLTQKAQGAAFADRIVDLVNANQGTAGPAFLRGVITDLDNTKALIRVGIEGFIAAAELPSDADGQVYRVATRFGIVAAAGEIAIALGVVPWATGAAIAATVKCFKAWLGARRGGAIAIEDTQAVEQVRRWLIAHHTSRFQLSGSSLNTAEKTHNQAGWYRLYENNKREYLIPTEIWDFEVCKGLDPHSAARACVEAKIVVPCEKDKRLNHKKNASGGEKQQRVYVCRLDGDFESA